VISESENKAVGTEEAGRGSLHDVIHQAVMEFAKNVTPLEQSGR